MAKLIDKVREHPDKIPSLTRDDMMELFNQTWEKTFQNVDRELAFEQNMVVIAFDGSEDHLVSTKLMDFVGKDMKAFRADLLKSKVSENFRDLEMLMAPSEGVVWKKLNPDGRAENEGLERFDANETFEEGKENEVDAESESDENGDDDQDGENQANTQVEEEPTEIAASTSSNVNMVFLEDMQGKLREGKKRCEIHMTPFFAKMENTVVEARQNRNKKKHYKNKKQMKLLNSNYNNKPSWKLMAIILTYLNRQHCIS